MGSLPLPPGLVPLTLHATDTALAVVCAPCRLLLYAAATRRLLLDVVLPAGQPLAGADTVVTLNAAGTWISWADAAAGLNAVPVSGLRRSASCHSERQGTDIDAPTFCVPAVEVIRMVWHHSADATGGVQLVTAEADGSIRLWQPELDGAHVDDSLLLSKTDAPVVQLDARDGWVLVSTLTHSMLISISTRTEEGGPEERPIGKAKRDGSFGACFLSGSQLLASHIGKVGAVLVAARPGARLWMVNDDGRVLSTLKLQAAMPDLSFGRLAMLAELDVILSWSNSFVCLVDPISVRVVASRQVEPPVCGVACVGISKANGSERTIELLLLHGSPRQLTTVSIPCRLPVDETVAREGAGAELPVQEDGTSTGQVDDVAACAEQFESAVLPAASATGSSRRLKRVVRQISIPGEPLTTPEIRTKTIDMCATSLSQCGAQTPGEAGSSIQAAAHIDANHEGSGNGAHVSDASQPSAPCCSGNQAASTGGAAAAQVGSGGRHADGRLTCEVEGGASEPTLSWAEGIALAVASTQQSRDTMKKPPSSSGHCSDSAGSGEAVGPNVLPADLKSSREQRVARWADRAPRPGMAAVVLLLCQDAAVLPAVIARLGRRLQLEQWVPLLALARAVDLNAIRTRQCGAQLSSGRPLSRAAADDCSHGWVSHAVLRAMLASCDVLLCLEVLRQLPELLEALPIEGYAELLLHAQRAQSEQSYASIQSDAPGVEQPSVTPTPATMVSVAAKLGEFG